jgi:hypothetical protein
MAKIAFFTERLPPISDAIAEFSYDLIRSLAEQQHEIRVFSTYRPEDSLPPSHPRIEILRPFRSWSLLEVPRLLPLLMDFQPDILHIIQPRAEALRGITGAMSALSGLAPLIGRTSVIASFYDLREEDFRRLFLILATSHAVTLSTQPQLALAKKFYAKLKRNPLLEILPISGTAPRPIADRVPEALAAFLASSQELIFVPGDVSDHVSSAQLFEELGHVLKKKPESSVIIGGGWGTTPPHVRHRLMRKQNDLGVGGRMLITGQLSTDLERHCLKHAKAVMMASLPAESLGAARILREALESCSLLIMGAEQVKADPLTWKHGENALIIPELKGHAGQMLIFALSKNESIDRIRTGLPEFSRREVIDQPGNVMSRIYAKLIESRMPQT